MSKLYKLVKNMIPRFCVVSILQNHLDVIEADYIGLQVLGLYLRSKPELPPPTCVSTYSYEGFAMHEGDIARFVGGWV